MMDAREAAVTVLDEDPRAELHWTVIWDRALRSGYLPPDPEARAELQRALAAAARDGVIEKTSTGTYKSGKR